MFIFGLKEQQYGHLIEPEFQLGRTNGLNTDAQTLKVLTNLSKENKIPWSA